MKFESDSSLKRVVKNSYFMAVSFAVFTLSGLFFVPFLIRQYGAEKYGLIALAGFLTQYVGFIAGCIGSSIGRFLNVSLNRSDWKEANEIYSTAIIGTVVLILLQLPFYAAGIWKLNWLIEFSPEQNTDFRILVGCNVLIFIVSLMMGVFSTPIQAANRLDINQVKGVVGELLRLVLLVVLILRIGPKLWIIGCVGLVLSLLQAVVTYYFSRRLASALKFCWESVTWKWIRPVMKMAVWSIIAGLGQILFQKTDVWIVNRFVDAQLAGVCAALLIWPNFVQQIAKRIGNLLMPVVMIDYSHGRFGRIRDLVLLNTRLLSLMSLFICGTLMVLGKWLLTLWMGEDYVQYHWVLVLMLLHFPLTLGREAVWLLFPAFNKMEYLGVSNLVSGVLNIILSLVLVAMGYGILGVVAATGVSLVLQRTLFLSYLASKLLEVDYRQFLRIYSGGGLLIIAVCVQHWIVKSNDYTAIGFVSMVVSSVLLIRVIMADPKFRGLLLSRMRKGPDRNAQV